MLIWPDLRHRREDADVRHRRLPFLHRSSRRFRASARCSSAAARLPAVRVDVNPTALDELRPRLGGRPGYLAAERQPARRTTSADGDAALIHPRPTSCSRPPNTSRSSSRTRTVAALRLSDIATVTDSVEDVRTIGLANGKPAILIIIFRQPGANIIETVDRIYALLPQLQASIPPTIALIGRARPHDDDPRVGHGRRDHDSDLDRARHPRRLPVPPERPLDDHPERRRAGFADRNVRRDVPPRLQHRQPVAHGA